jgi:hypothetical protein
MSLSHIVQTAQRIQNDARHITVQTTIAPEAKVKKLAQLVEELARMIEQLANAADADESRHR